MLMKGRMMMLFPSVEIAAESPMALLVCLAMVNVSWQNPLRAFEKSQVAGSALKAKM